MARRDDIVQAAMELVAEGGSHSLTHRRIDRRLGLPEGTTRTTRAPAAIWCSWWSNRLPTSRTCAHPMRRRRARSTEAVEQLDAAFEEVVARGVDTARGWR